MTAHWKTTARRLGAACLLSTLAGCASVTPEEIDALRAQVRAAQADAAAAREGATNARFMAERAIDEARTANSCCAANSEKMDRMFKKSMKK